MDNNDKLIDLLQHIDPAQLMYQEWINVGMALKHEGYTASDWDSWSRNDSRYHEGECFQRWDTFQGSSEPVTGGTIYHMAVENGYIQPERIYAYDDGRGALDWDSSISYDNDYRLINKSWVDGREFHEPKNWNPVQEIIRYLDTLFNSDDMVGYSTASYPKYDENGQIEKYLPQRGAYSRTAGQLINLLTECNGDVGAVLGDYNPEAGAWVRFNPLDGNGVKNENVASYRYALVESDNMEMEKQHAIMRELELPIAALVYSGNKSVHAIVKVEASTKEEYQKRVDYLYKICKKNGLNVDEQNKNPSRLSRLPGFLRGENKQYIIDTNVGQKNWEEWFQYIEDLNDDLPDPENLLDTWDNLPDLAPELIHGVLRQGHKMLIAGPSKAGKSFALIEMSIAIAEGTKWIGWQCSQGRVLYVNLELDKPSALHRFHDVYKAMGIPPKNAKNIDIWNLRGKTVPMDKLAPKLIRRAAKKDYIAVIIDPIYKVLTGDENSADQMAHFTNQFDKVATELGCSVIYCHHHSKGSQGGKKSMDRASGSGVFARDPDALVDLVELEVTEELATQQHNAAMATLYKNLIEKLNNNYYMQSVGLDDLSSMAQMRNHFEKAVPIQERMKYADEIDKLKESLNNRTAWRIEGTLREFAKFKPINMWFDYPIHKADTIGVLADIQLEENKPAWQKNLEKAKQNQKETAQQKKDKFLKAMEVLNDGFNPVTINDVIEYFSTEDRPISDKTVRRWVKNSGQFVIEKGQILPQKDD